MKEVKPKSFRIDDETAEKFKELSSKFGNQQETLAKLIETYEFQSGKAILKDKKADIEQFEKYVSCLTRMYMGALEDNQNISETVRIEFEALLKSKDITIQNLQKQISTLQNLTTENKLLENKLEESEIKLEKIQSQLADKEQLNKTLTESYHILKSKLDLMTEQISEAENIKSKLAELTNEKEQMKLDYQRKLLETEKKYQEEKQAEIDKYQQKYFYLLEQIQK